MLLQNTTHLFCFGLGYVGSALCEALLQRGWKISGTVRTEERRLEMAEKGFEVFLVQDSISDSMKKALSQASHILVTVPPTPDGDPIFNAYHAILSFNAQHVVWLGYLSSTIVYGDAKGGWVDEKTPTNPNNARGIRRVEAELHWANSGLACHIFRITGIYGPNRNALEKVKKGTAKPVIKENHVSCRIHIYDLIATLMASMNQPNSGSIYNLADDVPAPFHDVISYAAQLLNIAPPITRTIEEAKLSPMALSFYDGCRRIKNDKIKDDLGIILKYPNYREGLQALIKNL